MRRPTSTLPSSATWRGTGTGTRTSSNLLSRATSCADRPDLLQRLSRYDVIRVVQVHRRIAVRHGESHDVADRPGVLLRRIDDQAVLVAHENEVRPLWRAGEHYGRPAVRRHRLVARIDGRDAARVRAHDARIDEQ